MIFQPLEPLVIREINEEENKFIEEFHEEACNNIGKRQDENKEQVMMEDINDICDT